jgi:uncharacterized Zn finger protein
MATRRTEFGASWWARRWIGALESFGWDSRLARGRSYARGGRVIDVEVAAGVARARVKGSERRPYAVAIRLDPFSDDTWDRVLDVLAGQALYAAKLLAGELPIEVVELCEDAGAALFPGWIDELESSCSCPDWGNPCKHVAAVHYVLAAEFDRDPFLLFRLRGRSRDELFAGLRHRRGATEVEPFESPPREEAEPAELDVSAFWTLDPEVESLDIEIRPPDVPGAILKRLGRPPVWGAQDQFLASLELLYRTASANVRDRALGGWEPAEGSGDGEEVRPEHRQQTC